MASLGSLLCTCPAIINRLNQLRSGPAPTERKTAWQEKRVGWWLGERTLNKQTATANNWASPSNKTL